MACKAFSARIRIRGVTTDGLEAGRSSINPSKQELTFAGAHFSLWKAGQKDVMEIKGDRKGLGYRRYPQDVHLHGFHPSAECQRRILFHHRRT